MPLSGTTQSGLKTWSWPIRQGYLSRRYFYVVLVTMRPVKTDSYGAFSHRFRTGLPANSACRATTLGEMLAAKCAAFWTSAVLHVVAAHLAAPGTLSPEAVPAAVKAAARTDTLKVVPSTVLVSKT